MVIRSHRAPLLGDHVIVVAFFQKLGNVSTAIGGSAAVEELLWGMSCRRAIDRIENAINLLCPSPRCRRAKGECD